MLGALGAELCCRATGATAGRLSAYLLERCGSEAAQLCAQRRRFGFCLLVWFFVSKVSEASQGGVEGILESYGPATLDAAFTTLLWLSRRACFLDLLAARIDVYEENERRSTPHAVLVGRTGRSLVENEPAHSSPKSFTGAVVLTPKSAIT